MEWLIFFILSVLGLILTATLFISNTFGKKRKISDPSKVAFIGVIVSAALLFIPIYLNEFKNNGCGLIETFFVSVHNVIRLFVVDGDFQFITDNAAAPYGWLVNAYTILFSVLFILAPMLTYVFVLSFFKSVSANINYVLHYNHDVYVFSDLSEKSLTLATDLLKSKTENKRFVIFTNINENTPAEQIIKAEKLGAVCFKKDIMVINFSLHSKKAEIVFLTIGEDMSENVNTALKIIEKYKTRENTSLYVFSSQIQAEALIAGAFNKENDADIKIKVRRINEIESLVIRTLYETGYEKVFLSARSFGEEKIINAVVLGMGQHGTEMTKALSWFGQMTGYRLYIDSFDLDPKAESRFISLCPELMDNEHNGNFTDPGEAQYKITIHSDMDINTAEFDDAIKNLSGITYVFVALGDDDLNIAAAMKIRRISERNGFKPEIQAIVNSAEKKQALQGMSNYKGQEYKIDFIGDLESSLSESVIMAFDIEQKALKRHLDGNYPEQAFWRYDYGRKSSMASAVHRIMKSKCKIPGIDLAPQNRAVADRELIRVLEHRRWNAYMRSEGYVYGGTINPEGRYDLAKKHNCLVTFEELPPDEKTKDDD